jgi:DNA-directed RNA polymerase specialized sigma24 family protein
MALSDPDLLCAAQSAAATSEIRNEFADRFLGCLRFFAGRYCVLYKLNFDLIDDVVDEAILMVLDDTWVRFDFARGDTHLAYLRGMVQNASKRFARFIHRGGKLLQSWTDPLIVQLKLPTCLEEVPEQVPSLEVEELAEVALQVALPDELVLIRRHFYGNESMQAIADSMGVARTTISRRLERYYARAFGVIAA